MALIYSTDKLLRQIYDAICANCPSLLSSVLQSIDPELHLPGVKFQYTEFICLEGENENDYKERCDIASQTFGAKYQGIATFVSFLHLAVYNCESTVRNGRSTIDAIKILDILISHHLQHSDIPSWSQQYDLCNNTVIFNTTGYCYVFGNYESPTHFAAVLKLRLDDRILTECINKLLKYESDLRTKLTRKEAPMKVKEIPMKLIPESVFNTFCSLLFSEKFADVVFEITDETNYPPTMTKIFAHRAVLASSSDYFNIMLSGKWKESHSSECHSSSEQQAVVKVKQTLDVYKCLLTFIYTGKIETDVIRNHSLELLDLAAQGQYHALTSLCEVEAIKNIVINNVIGMLLSATRYELQDLKIACINFIKSNTALLMFNHDLMDLEKTHKKLYNDIRRALGQVVTEEDDVEDDEDKHDNHENKDKENNDRMKLLSKKLIDKSQVSSEKKRSTAEADSTSKIPTADSTSKRVLRSTTLENL